MKVAHPIHRVSRVETPGNYHLLVHFMDGTSQMIDFAPVLKGELYGPPRDVEAFSQEHEQAFRELAQSWETVRT